MATYVFVAGGGWGIIPKELVSILLDLVEPRK